MRVLLVSNTFPSDPDRAVHGIYQRLETFVDALRGHKIEALFFVPDDVETGESATRLARERLADAWGADVDVELCQRAPTAAGRWEEYFAGMLSLDRQARYRLTSGPNQVATLERRLRRKPEAIFVHRLTAMAPMLQLPVPEVPMFFDLDDVEHVAFERQIRTPPVSRGQRLLRWQLPALRRGERQALERSTLSFVCSDDDRDYLRMRYRTDAVETVPNSVPIPPPDTLAEEREAPPRVLFLGNYAHPPNRSAADRLTTLWPSVRERAPEARLVLAGPKPELLSSYDVRPDGVEFPGFVDDLADLYRNTALVCAPIEEGGGTRVKLLEAGAWRCPIVATRIAAEGIGFEDEVHYLMRDDDDAIADACVDLLNDPARGRTLGRAARELVSDRYSKRAVTEQVRRLFASHGLPDASNASGAA